MSTRVQPRWSLQPKEQKPEEWTDLRMKLLCLSQACKWILTSHGQDSIEYAKACGTKSLASSILMQGFSFILTATFGNLEEHLIRTIHQTSIHRTALTVSFQKRNIYILNVVVCQLQHTYAPVVGPKVRSINYACNVAANHPADTQHGWWEWSGNSWLKQTPIKVVSHLYQWRKCV
jgi:hypothetical protein